MEDRSGHWEINVEEATGVPRDPRLNQSKHISSPSPGFSAPVLIKLFPSEREVRNFTWTMFSNLTSRL